MDSETLGVSQEIVKGLKHIKYHNGDEVLHVVTFDLKSISLRTRVSQLTDVFIPGSKHSGATVRTFSERVKAVVAINGDFYNTKSHAPIGVTMGDGQNWGAAMKQVEFPFLACTLNNDCVVDYAGAKTVQNPEWKNIISGQERLLDNGVLWSKQDDYGCGPFCNTRLPRSSVGISKDRSKLFLFMAEGRRSDVPGVTLNRLAELMKREGAHNGFNFDGGGSSQLVIKGKLVSARPGDEPDERAVSSSLAIVNVER